MAKVGGGRNFGFGKQMAWAGKQALRERYGDGHYATVAELARELGLRAREASMLDSRTALRQATTHRAVNITAGTKGGRGHRVDRWVPVSEGTLEVLERAVTAQGTTRNLIPAQMSRRQWHHHLHHTWSATADRFGLGKLHDLRASYACERYAAITGTRAPVCGGHRTVERDRDRNARLIIAEELGHARIDIVATYIGGAR